MKPDAEALASLAALSARVEIGHLAIVTADGYPRAVPVNFVMWRNAIYFHGSPEGEKADVFRRGEKVTFGVFEVLAGTPSYWRAEKYACPAGQYFRSALVRGRGRLVEDVDEKAGALQTLMEKHQLEGGYERIEAGKPLYAKPLEETAVFCVTPDRIDFLDKLGQNLSAEARNRVIDGLLKRQRPRDVDTAEAIKAANRKEVEES
jgi:nitroimidazol reductase NimA-like FMN-containing flavoprotein (pyridoxamine 5'-phosphate oxidase superfamily)